MKKTNDQPCHVRVTGKAQKSAEIMKKQGRGDIVSDVLGSYTGTAQNGEIPEQDADDL